MDPYVNVISPPLASFVGFRSRSLRFLLASFFDAFFSLFMVVLPLIVVVLVVPVHRCTAAIPLAGYGAMWEFRPPRQSTTRTLLRSTWRRGHQCGYAIGVGPGGAGVVHPPPWTFFSDLRSRILIGRLVMSFFDFFMWPFVDLLSS